MQIALNNFHIEGDLFTFVFLKEKEDKKEEINIKAELEWRHDPDGFEWVSGFKEFYKTVPFTRNHVEDTLTRFMEVITINLPNNTGRELFKNVLSLWAKIVKCPLDIKMIEHPQYPLMNVVYNHEIILDSELDEIMESILKGIENATVVEIEEEPAAESELEEAEETAEAEIFDYEFDTDLTDAMDRMADIDSGEEFEDIDINVGEIIKGDNK